MYVHDLSPFAIHFYDQFGVRWYGLAYIFGFFAAYVLIKWLAGRQRTGMNGEMVSDFITYAAVGTLVGGRVGYCLFYSPDLFTKFKDTFPFWGVLAVNEGGMASHGGMIGIAIACMLFARKYGLSLAYLFDLVCVSGPIGVFAGRIANFINGELVGRPVEDQTLAWAMKFPTDIYLWPQSDQSRLAQMGTVVEKIGISPSDWSGWVEKFKMDAGARDQVYAAFAKIIEQIQNGNTALKEALAPLLVARHPSQLYEALMEGLLLFLVLFFLWRKPRRPGFIASVFIILYPIVRIIGEQFRMPDAHIGYQLLGLTRGQWLSLGMLLVGFISLFWWGRSSSKVINGWGRLYSIKLNRK